MEFVHPERLWWLALLPGVLLLWRASARHRIKARAAFEDFLKVSRISRTTTGAHEAAGALALLLTVAVLIVAAAQPWLELERTQPVYRKQDVVLILDTSLSMRARDIHPSRIDRAREEIRNFILDSELLIDRVGLVTFSGTSVITSYLTSDRENILFYLDFMDVGPRINFGTNIGSALNSALTLIRAEAERLEVSGQEDPNQKVFFLLADGEDYGEELDQAVTATVSARIPVYALGIGADQDAPIPVPAQEEYLLRDEAGNLVPAGFDESSLQRVAAVTGGRYFRSHTGAELAPIMSAFLESAREVVGEEVVVERVDLYPRLLIGAAVLLAVFLLI